LNYYPFHIGDFAAHTSHLSCEEDIAYRRMLDWYYLNERALPLDVPKVARLIRMPKSQPAIQVVLDEFFVRSDDGWHNKRADEELTSMLAKQEQQAAKDQHEAERMRRYRERRASMFTALRAVHVVPAWDVPMKELQRLFDTHCNTPETDLQREQVISQNGPATAIPTPTPTPTPTPKEVSFSDNSVGAADAARPPSPAAAPPGRGARATQLPEGWVLPKSWGDWALAEYAHWTPDVVRLVGETFRDHWRSKSGKDARKADWLATWRNWCRSDITQRTHPSPQFATAETTYQRSMRERMQEAAPEFARKAPAPLKPMENVIEFFAAEAASKRLEIGNEPTAAVD
jgi:uncharacterized protein YdaU (DUF1376 family)